MKAYVLLVASYFGKFNTQLTTLLHTSHLVRLSICSYKRVSCPYNLMTLRNELCCTYTSTTWHACVWVWHIQHEVLREYKLQSICMGTLHCGHPRPRSIKPFLPQHFLSWHHSRDKIFQSLSRYSVLQATESWAGPGNEATDYIDLLTALVKLG